MTTTIPPALRRTPSPAQALRNTLAMAHRSLLTIKRTPEQFLDVVAQPILFTVLFTFLFGGAIAGDTTSYLTFLIPGILVQSIITASVTTGAGLREDMNSGVFDRFRTLPIARIAPLAGALLIDILRYTIAAITTFLAGFALGYRPDGGFGAIVGAALLVIGCAWAMSWAFAYVGVVSRTAEALQGIAIFVLYPLTLLSGAFVPIATMPGWLQTAAHFNPVTYLVSAARELLNTGMIGADFTLSIVTAVLIVIVFAPLAVRAYQRNAR
ncbi:ABC transporter permease [Pseudactinotalea sp.]|uniref:ABC transporter permease n=1 Tax=Pseudactinotalea sp. TaxID=1926260 RepID=UPI003B3AF38C